MVVGLQSIFPPISPPILFYHFPLLQEFDSKKPSSPFNDLDKFLKPITAISFPLTIRHWKVAFKQDHREQLIENKQEKNSFSSSWENILSVAPQGSILGPLLFKIYVHDIFLILKTTYFTGYADGNMLFVVGEDTTDVLKALE